MCMFKSQFYQGLKVYFLILNPTALGTLKMKWLNVKYFEDLGFGKLLFKLNKFDLIF